MFARTKISKTISIGCKLMFTRIKLRPMTKVLLYLSRADLILRLLDDQSFTEFRADLILPIKANLLLLGCKHIFHFTSII